MVHCHDLGIFQAALKVWLLKLSPLFFPGFLAEVVDVCHNRFPSLKICLDSIFADFFFRIDAT